MHTPGPVLDGGQAAGTKTQEETWVKKIAFALEWMEILYGREWTPENIVASGEYLRTRGRDRLWTSPTGKNRSR